ncbi:hypothetical protein H8F21_15570 [Pseudomonas sp. P66]|uniref:Uncharacterized protein n=1 Tax=Pseudomonas arcuscaelestis TaxID=2710591 RepID=A0ABS2BZC3_9PSED|nr:hypothetical protein [Pseudomonas arcuscaelestis]MBM5458986.1 hypothetical protein [Pseudomonas arcuscaelestis]
MGNDPLVALCIALERAMRGERVAIAPDTLDTGSWPKPDYAQNALAIFNCWDEAMAREVAKQFPSLPLVASLPECLTALSKACMATGRVTLIDGTTFQTSHGYIRGDRNREVLFPLRPGQRDTAGLNPAWKFLSRRLNRTLFNHRELEFVSAGAVVLTSHPSSFVDSSGTAYTRVGQARVEKPEVVDASARVDDLRSAFPEGMTQCSQA